MLYPMALLSTGPFHSSPRFCKQGKEGPILQNRLLRLRPKPIRAKLSRPFGWESFSAARRGGRLILSSENVVQHFTYFFIAYGFRNCKRGKIVVSHDSLFVQALIEV